MNMKAFLYSGVTFLLMVSIMISMSYLLLQKHSKEQSNIANLQLDLVHEITIDLGDLLAVGGNNTFSDAMADAAFQAINRTPSGSQLTPICNDLSPIATSPRFNITKWILNYTNLTLTAIQNHAPLLNLKSVVANPTIVTSACNGNTIVYIWQKSNISYEITLNDSSFYMRLNQTVVHNKTLTITYNGDNFHYNVTIKDETGKIDFMKNITCGLGGGKNCESS
jgi:hypothetical protein